MDLLSSIPQAPSHAPVSAPALALVRPERLGAIPALRQIERLLITASGAALAAGNRAAMNALGRALARLDAIRDDLDDVRDSLAAETAWRLRTSDGPADYAYDPAEGRAIEEAERAALEQAERALLPLPQMAAREDAMALLRRAA
jgi:hypothetical protein